MYRKIFSCLIKKTGVLNIPQINDLLIGCFGVSAIAKSPSTYFSEWNGMK